MDNTILQYQISDWDQLSKCQSNLSPDYKIRVCHYVQNKDIKGINVSVHHSKYGILLAYTINPQGDLVNPLSPDVKDIVKATTLLNELRRYGFYVDYVEEENLKPKMLELLKTIQGLHFDKLRLLFVHENNNPSKGHNYITAFSVSRLPEWINSGYSPSQKEWESALVTGSAFNVSGLENGKVFNWSWAYNAIFDIDELIENNTEVQNE